MGFRLKMLTSYIKSVDSFWERELQSGKNIFFENTYLVTIHKYILKKSATNVIPSYLLPSKGKVL